MSFEPPCQCSHYDPGQCAPVPLDALHGSALVAELLAVPGSDGPRQPLPHQSSSLAKLDEFGGHGVEQESLAVPALWTMPGTLRVHAAVVVAVAVAVRLR